MYEYCILKLHDNDMYKYYVISLCNFFTYSLVYTAKVLDERFD